MNTCDGCKHYKPARSMYKSAVFNGDCDKLDKTAEDDAPEDGLGTWGAYGEPSGFHVGPKFGCIHWEAK